MEKGTGNGKRVFPEQTIDTRLSFFLSEPFAHAGCYGSAKILAEVPGGDDLSGT